MLSPQPAFAVQPEARPHDGRYKNIKRLNFFTNLIWQVERVQITRAQPEERSAPYVVHSMEQTNLMAVEQLQ